jgi:D-alanyl-D-alanine carboxypeptidase
VPLIPPIFNSISSADPAGSRRGFLRQGTLAALALSLHGRLPAETPTSAPALVQAFMTEFSVPGMQVSFRRGATTLWDGCFGEADRSGHRAVKPDSLFRIASDSKAFTAAAILLLVEDGRMHLQDRIFAPGGVLHQFAVLGLQPEWLNVVTVHQLLTHTCGGWDNSGDDPMFERPGLDHDQLIAWTLRTHPLQHPPGEKYAYSNFGYCLLGRVIERIGGLPYPQFVREHVLRPAGIHDMRIGTHRAAPNEVHYYGQDDGDPYGIPIFRMDSHGGWIATAADLSRFMACLFSPKDPEGALPILQSESLSVMTTGTTANPGYGCGLAVNRVGNAWHSGSLPGTMSLMVHTQSGMSWAAVLNTRSPAEGAALRLDRMLWQIAQSVPDWVA